MMGELDDVLSRLVDAHGLHKVCTALMVICYGKAEHPATNWQDRITARQWENAAKAMDATLPRAAIVSPAQP
jgi:hypothetical protein